MPPEQLLLASLLQAFYGIRSERLLLEQLHYNLLFRWFVGLSPDDPIWHPTTFTKNCERLLNDDVMGRFLEKLMCAPEVKSLLSDEHFSVDGTLLQAWASHASLERIDGKDVSPPPPSGPSEGFGAPTPGTKRAKGDFRGIKLSNKTHRFSVDPDALLCRKSKAHPALPSYRGHLLMDNRHALIVDCRVTQPTGTGEKDAAQAMAAERPGAHQKTIGLSCWRCSGVRAIQASCWVTARSSLAMACWGPGARNAMAIELQDSARIGAPVIRQQRLGEVAHLAVVRTEQRDRLRRNHSNGEMEPIPNGSDRQGRPRFKQEMVIHALALPGTTMEARLGDEGGVPAAGDRVRLVLKARGFGDWIEARRGHRKGKLNVGDVLTLETRWAQQYDQDGNAKGPKIADQAAARDSPDQPGRGSESAEYLRWSTHVRGIQPSNRRRQRLSTLASSSRNGSLPAQRREPSG